jgi:hypothetical protein
MSERSLLDRLVALSKPTWLPDARAPREIAPGLWSVDRTIAIGFGPRLATRALLVDLPEGGMLAWSPTPLDDALREFVAARGGARFLVAPNSFHYLALAEWLRAFPHAECWLAPGLPARVGGAAPPGRELLEGAATPFGATLPHRALLGGNRNSEVAFFHAQSRVLLLVDSVFNLRHAERWIDRAIWRGYGALGRFGPTATAHMFLLRDRKAVAAWIEAICAWPFECVVMAHGEAHAAGPAELREAFARFFR